jgi:hypothetical protein
MPGAVRMFLSLSPNKENISHRKQSNNNSVINKKLTASGVGGNW